MQALIQAIQEALGNFWMLLVYGIALILGAFLLKGKRKLFLIPAAVMTLLILNPLTRTIWDKVNDYGYWRLLWILPLIPVIAAVPAAVTEKTQKWYLRLLTVILSASIVILSGSLIYANEATAFTEADNPDKMPADALETAEVLLEMDDEPHVVADQYMAIYLRQYSGKIKTAFGRDLGFGDPSAFATEIAGYLSDGEMAKVAEMMRSGGYRFLVTRNLDFDRQNSLEKAGFEYVWQINEFGIYEIN